MRAGPPEVLDQLVPPLCNQQSIKDFAPDAALGRSFYVTTAHPNDYSAIFDSITAFDMTTYMPSSVVPLPFLSFETGSSFTGLNVVRWGQDGLAILSSRGTIYLVRGPVVRSCASQYQHSRHAYIVALPRR